MNKEEFFIKQFENNFLGDDGAVINKFVYSKDIFVEDIHFKLKWLSLNQIAKKAFLVNISDAIVMNAKPKYALIGICIPKTYTKKDFLSLANGFKQIAKKYKVKIIGGDTTQGKSLVISISLISKAKNPIFRHNMKEGDLIAYTGDIGSVLKDLNFLMQNKTISKNSKFIKPVLKDKFFYQASKYINSALDISDGLSKDLSRLCKASNLGVKFLKNISKSKLCSGEEYEILFSFDEEKTDKILKIAQKTNTNINIFAKAIKGTYQSECKENHF